MAHVTLEGLSSWHQALSDPIRLVMVRLLLERELCVCELMAALNLPQYKVSRHLGILKRAGLVRDWREGSWVHYQVDPDLDMDLRVALTCLRVLLDRDQAALAALGRLASAALRSPGQPATTQVCLLHQPGAAERTQGRRRA